MAKPADSRTEKATPKRKRDARRKGDAARSTELPQSMSLVAAIVVIVPALSSLWSQLQIDTIDLIRNGHALEPTRIGIEAADAMQGAAATLIPMLVVVVGVSVLSQLALVGRPNAWKLKPKFDALNPQNGLKRIFSRQQLWELSRTILKLTLLAVLAFVSWGALSDFLALGPAPLSAAFLAWGGVVERFAIGVGLLGLTIGVGDAVLSKRNFERKLRMSRQEVKDELKQAEGDPLIRSQIRQAQHRMSRLRMLAAVADASVVVTNPTHLSVALRYEKGDEAPVVVAKGADEMALRIRAEARRQGIPVRENRTMARTLFATANIDEPIPVALYKAVAQLLASIYTSGAQPGAAT